MTWRWHELSTREKRIALKLVIEEKKWAAIAIEERISKTRVGQIWEVVRGKLGAGSRIKLAFEMGKHWREIGK